MATASPIPTPAPDSLVQSLDRLVSEGYSHNLVPDEGGVRVSGDDSVIPTKQLTVEVVRRFEGLTNPGDQAILYGIRLPDGRKGALALGYGPSASSKDAALLQALPER